MDGAAAVKAIQTRLSELGYRAQDVDGEQVLSSTAGCKFTIVPYGDESIQFYCGFNHEAVAAVTADKVNEFNRNKRFSKAFFDSDGGLVLEADWWLNVTTREGLDSMAHALSIFEASIYALITEVLDS